MPTNSISKFENLIESFTALSLSPEIPLLHLSYDLPPASPMFEKKKGHSRRQTCSQME
ncbi:hypothetical protein RHMOL_Rhmol04G0195200 [Rhododendron molle]|uniref:Uncharacterized protein n=1 Tax=Rhododendron molle TaxID=49168 RepID=A0ACC0P4F5_RHOML|nr:hypothetical protein RHMOL_Rhmol04G0195200 [Rhododendron molle]